MLVAKATCEPTITVEMRAYFQAVVVHASFIASMGMAAARFERARRMKATILKATMMLVLGGRKCFPNLGFYGVDAVHGIKPSCHVLPQQARLPKPVKENGNQRK